MKHRNCPHHNKIYSAKTHRYRELPIRYRETTTCYRDEQSGELNGLSRVRAFTQDDAHVFARTKNIEQEVTAIWEIVERFYGAFDSKLSVRLSSHDPASKDGYMGDTTHGTAAKVHRRQT